MDIDFSSLASRIAADVGGLRGCIIASRDGLVLGAYPADGEAVLRPAWLRFAALGDVEKGFIEFGGETWVYVQRGPYAAFAVSEVAARPGLILEEMEQILRSAEEARSRQPSVRMEGGDAARSKPRTTLHPEARPSAPAPASGVPAQAASASPAQEAAAPAPPPTDTPQVISTDEPQPASEVPAPSSDAPTPSQEVAPAASPPAPQPQEGDVDRVLLAQEFAQLLEDSGYDDEEDE
ncbi:MAG: hypothetical protein WD004_07330 [Actinomycetota bacterium]